VPDPFSRLDRAPAGAHLLGLPALVLKLQARSERPVPEPPTLTGGERRSASGATRRATRLARAEPHAPQLIRIVKTPYALAPGRGRRAKVREARERRAEVGRLHPVAELSSVRRRAPSRSPAGTRARPEYPTVPRDLAARYLESVAATGGPR